MFLWTDTTLANGYLLELPGKSQETEETGWVLEGRDRPWPFRVHLVWQTVYVPHLSPNTRTRQVQSLSLYVKAQRQVKGLTLCVMTPMTVACTHVHMSSHPMDSFISSPPTWPSLLLALVLASWGLHTKRTALSQDTALTHQGPTSLPPLLTLQRTSHGRHQAWLDQRDQVSEGPQSAGVLAVELAPQAVSRLPGSGKLKAKQDRARQGCQVQSRLRSPLSGCDVTVCSFPTSGVLVHIDNLRWEGVPFILMSGKALDERVGYVRIVFKNRAYCTQSERHWVPEQSRCLPQQIVFYIGHGELGHPAVLVSRNLFKPSLPTQSWKEVQDQPGLRLFGRPLSDYYAYRPVREQDAYSTLLSHIFHCRKESFITTENLLASWVFWTPLLDSLAFEVPRPYPGGAENGQLLDFEFSGGQLTFSQQQLEVLIPDLGSVPKPSDFQVLGAQYRQSPLITAWPEELISKLANDIEAAAVQAVRRFGKFHLALSGGSSPIALFQQLATGHYSFPWAHTHLWLVDERCVPLSDPDSNFQGLQAHLLQHVRIPYYNIHPMPVHLHQRLCAEEDQGAQTYASEISALVANSSFDLVLLGMGTDGHTASLFPQSPTGLDGDQLVVLTESPFRPHQRMSLSLPLINRAKKVAVLVMGRTKREIATLVSRVGHEPKKWPISGVVPLSGQLVWYMDYEAFLG